ncbi:MAG: hypothetical protein AB8B73_09175 [Ekhidna sp.]
MLIEEKYFQQDKNYLLKSVQAFSKEGLLDSWLKQVFIAYNNQHNPMGLEDDFIIELRSKIHIGKSLLVDNYDILAAAYRLLHGDNQLEIRWDGRSHLDAYDEEWKATFNKWVTNLCLIKEIQRPIIRYAISSSEVNSTFLSQSLRKGILSYFKLKLKSQKLYRAA